MGLTIGRALAGAGSALGAGIQRGGEYKYSAEEEKRRRIDSDIANILGMIGKAPIEQLKPYLGQARGYQEIDYEGLAGVIGRYDAAEREDEVEFKRLMYASQADLDPGNKTLREMVEEKATKAGEEVTRKKTKAELKSAQEGELHTIKLAKEVSRKKKLSREEKERGVAVKKAETAKTQKSWDTFHSALLTKQSSLVDMAKGELKRAMDTIKMLGSEKELFDVQVIDLKQAREDRDFYLGLVPKLSDELVKSKGLPAMQTKDFLDTLIKQLGVHPEDARKYAELYTTGDVKSGTTQEDYSIPFGPQLPSSTKMGIPD